MGAQGWEEALDSTIASGSAITAAQETIICPDFNIPAYYMAVGRTIRIYASGIISTVITTPGTGVWRVRWGGVNGIQLLASAAQNFATAGATTNAGWNMTCLITCQAVGVSGQFMSSGELNCFDEASGTASNLLAQVMGSAGTNNNAAVQVNTTVANLLSCTFTQTVTTGSMTCQQRIIEVLN